MDEKNLKNIISLSEIEKPAKLVSQKIKINGADVEIRHSKKSKKFARKINSLI